MKNVTTNMLNYLASGNNVLATCWKVTRQDGTILGFTDWDVDLTDGVTTYKASTGYTRTAIAGENTLAVPNLEVQGVLDSTAITDEDIRSGKYDHADVRIFLVVPPIGAGEFTNEFTTEFTLYQSALNNFNYYGMIKLRRGFTGQIRLTEGQHTTEIRGIAQLLAENFIENFTLDCQADFCDTRCKQVAANFTSSGKVTSVTNSKQFAATILSGASGATIFNFGVISWTAGNNVGLNMEVKNWDGGNFTLYLGMGRPIQVNDTFTVLQGCDHTFATCKSRFNNAINFRGFPNIPGLDLVMFPQASLQFGSGA